MVWIKNLKMNISIFIYHVAVEWQWKVDYFVRIQTTSMWPLNWSSRLSSCNINFGTIIIRSYMKHKASDSSLLLWCPCPHSQDRWLNRWCSIHHVSQTMWCSPGCEAVKVRFPFSSSWFWESCWRLHFSLGGELAVRLGAVHVTTLPSASSPGVSIVGTSRVSVVRRKTVYSKNIWKGRDDLYNFYFILFYFLYLEYLIEFLVVKVLQCFISNNSSWYLITI